jgi:hypothetical protein
VRYARRHAHLLPLEKVPFKEQWRKYDGEGNFTYTVEYGVSLDRLGFRYEPLPDGEDFASYKYPLSMDRELFICSDPNRFNYRFVRGFFKPNPRTTVFSSRWVDKTNLLRRFDAPDKMLIRVVRIGNFIWCNNSIDRVVHRYLRGGSLPAMYLVKEWR